MTRVYSNPRASAQDGHRYNAVTASERARVTNAAMTAALRGWQDARLSGQSDADALAAAREAFTREEVKHQPSPAPRAAPPSGRGRQL